MNPRQRISDWEREQAASLLAQHYTDGRLQHQEYDDRLGAVWTAQTNHDLDVVFSDLPRPPDLARPAAPPDGVRPGRKPIHWLLALVVLLVLSGMFEAPLWFAIFALPWLNGRRTGHRGWGHGGSRHPSPH